MRQRRSFTLAALAAATALTLAACGGGDDDASGDESGSDGGLTEVTIGALPIMPTAALQVGLDQGFFEDHGLDVTIEMGQGGAAIIPSVVSGETTAGTSNVISLLQARAQGLDVRVTNHWSSGATEEPDVVAIMTQPDSGIETPADLEGRTIAVNTLNNIAEMAIRASIQADGGDDSQVEFVEMGFPDMPAALAAGNVDATYSPEPFMTLIQDSGGVVVSYPNLAVAPGIPTQMFFMGADLIENEPELAEAITAAIDETLEYAEANQDEVRAAAVEMLDMDPDLADRVALEHFGTDLRREEVQAIADTIYDLGMIDVEPDVAGLLPTE
jgi:NitT/TauT family transport system substrate-binding protein